MNWEDEGFLLSKTKFRENANIINVFSKLYGRVNGIVYGMVVVGLFYMSNVAFGNKLEEIISKKE